MKYVCSKCSRTMEWDEELSFCPFCGTAYQPSKQSAPSAVEMRIAVGSDSERTIQEKYWDRSRNAVNNTLDRLRASLPRFSEMRDQDTAWDEKIPEQYKTKLLARDELSELEHCTSTAEFRSKMKIILETVEKEYQANLALMELEKKAAEEAREMAMERDEWSVAELEDEYSIDVDAEEAFIQQFCTELAENLGSMLPARLQPELDYDPDETDWMNDEEDNEDLLENFALFPDYASLWKEIQSSASALTSALESNGLFALTLVHGEVQEDFKPKQCAKELRTLKNGDYDPLFGESPEPFVRTFFDGLANLMQYINELPGYIEIMELSPEQKLLNLKNELDRIKLDSLLRLIDRWSEILSLELDRLYQSRSENMMDVCSGIEKMWESLDEKE